MADFYYTENSEQRQKPIPEVCSEEHHNNCIKYTEDNGKEYQMFYLGESDFFDKDTFNYNFDAISKYFDKLAEYMQQVTFDKIYPIGSVYITVDPEFDPNNAFGGTWEKLDGHYYLMAANNNEEETSNYPKVGDTINGNLPQHNHIGTISEQTISLPTLKETRGSEHYDRKYRLVGAAGDYINSQPSATGQQGVAIVQALSSPNATTVVVPVFGYPKQSDRQKNDWFNKKPLDYCAEYRSFENITVPATSYTTGDGQKTNFNSIELVPNTLGVAVWKRVEPTEVNSQESE